MSRFIVLPALALTLALAPSCTTMSKVGKSTASLGKSSVNFVKNTASRTGSKVSELSELAVNTVRPNRLKIVDVREKDLKEMPTGQEQALAFENTRKKSMWSFFGGPVDFKEPVLPEAGGEMDGSLLPPKPE